MDATAVRDYLDSGNPLAFALMARMNYDRRERVRLKADFLRLILGSSTDDLRRSLLVEFVETYAPLRGNELHQFQELICSKDQYEEVEKMVTVYEQRGIEKGMAKGKQNSLLQLLSKKFGSVPDELAATIRSTDSISHLDEMLLSVLDAKSINKFLD